MEVPKGVKWHLHPPFCGILLGPQTFWDVEMKFPTSLQGRVLFTSFWTRSGLGDLKAEYKEQGQSVGLLTSKWFCGKVLSACQRPCASGTKGLKPTVHSILFYTQSQDPELNDSSLFRSSSSGHSHGLKILWWVLVTVSSTMCLALLASTEIMRKWFHQRASLNINGCKPTTQNAPSNF